MGAKDSFVAVQLNYLFETVLQRDGEPFTDAQVAEGMSAILKENIGRGYVGQLRRGINDNPTFSRLGAIAQFFGVPPGFFYPDTPADQREAMQALVELRTKGVAMLALRSLAAVPKETVEELIEVVERDRTRRQAGKPTTTPFSDAE